MKASAVEEEDLPFDPSGTSGGRAQTQDVDSEPSMSHNTLGSLETDTSAPPSNVSSSGSHDRNGKGKSGRVLSRVRPESRPPDSAHNKFGAVSNLGLDGKIEYLTEMFPSIERFTITHTLRKCDEDIDRCMDVLLNLAFFDQENPDDPSNKISVPKGIDGFAGDDDNRRKGRNRKGRARQNKGHVLGQSEPSSPLIAPSTASVENKWDSGKKDVEFICSRTYLSYQSVLSAYHSNAASLPATIHFLAARETDKHSENLWDDAVTASQVAELREEFASVPPEKLVGLLGSARNSISAANELATVMTSEPTPSPSIDLTPQVRKTPVPSEWNQASTARKSAASTSAQRSTSDHTTLRGYAVDHLSAGQDAFEKAGAAYRRGKSDRLMGGAAGYYSAVGREHVEQAKKEAKAAADALVNEQSTDCVLDLHGVSVHDAVRIAGARVADWWESLGDAKYANGGGRNPAREGYRIVTGMGKHSRTGTARLGPAVAKMLMREGWRVEVGNGVLVVTGLVKHR